MIGFVQFGTLEYRINLDMLGMMPPKGRVPHHKVIQIDNPPGPEPILPQPLHQSLQLITTLQWLQRRHLILHHAQMLPSVHIPGDIELWHC